jgi:hypothetical protein
MSYRLTLAWTVLTAGALAFGAKVASAEPVPITVRAYDEDPGGKALADPVEAQVGAALAADGRFAFTSVVDRLEPPVEVARALGRADLAIIDAETAFQQMDLAKAKTLITGAIASYQRYLPELAARGGGVTPLRDAWIKLAKSRFFDGDLDGARDALRYVFVLDPKVEYDPTTFPPQMKKMVIEAKLLFETLGPGKLVVDSDPNGAVAWLNGVKLDKPTPTDVVAAPPGPNYVSVRRRGWAPLTTVVEENGSGDQATALESLTRYPKHPIADLERARAHLDESDTPAGLAAACGVLGVKMLVLVRFAKVAAPTGDTRLTAYLYDARPNRILKRASIVTTADGAPSAAHALTGELLRGVRLDGIYIPPKPPVRPNWWQRFSVSTRDHFDRFHHSKYFWYVVGGAAGAVALGVGLGVGIGVSQHQQTIGQAVILLGGN